MKSIKTKKVKKINDKTVIATLDIGKNIQYGYFRAPNGNDVKPFAFYNSKKSYNEFWQKLCQFKNKEGLEEIVIGFESTGPYAEPLFNFLRKKPALVVKEVVAFFHQFLSSIFSPKNMFHGCIHIWNRSTLSPGSCIC